MTIRPADLQNAPSDLAVATEATLDLDNAHILVAEDDVLSRKLTIQVLERNGYRVVDVSDGEAAITALGEYPTDLLLLDVGLPGITGLDVTRIARADARYATLPILLLTGRSEYSDIVTGLEAGADDYILKPVDPSVLIARVRSALRTRRALHGLEAANSVVAALATAIDAKDVLTERHSQRLGSYAAALGNELGLTPPDLAAVTYGALLHDVGKIGVPEAILTKPGPLTDDEWKVMRLHTEIGERIAAPLASSVRLGSIIRHHHERWNGTGYPDRLAGEAIPMGARIVGIVDAFDAMTHDRVYRKALSTAEAIAELRRERGVQFDPEMTDAFLRIVEWQGLPGESLDPGTGARPVPGQGLEGREA